MKTRTAALAGLLIGLALGASHLASATSTPPPVGAVANYVNPAFQSPKAPQTCGEDGGAACQLTFSQGACLRIATQGTWKYQVNAFDGRSDGTSLVVLATGALIVGVDGGACLFADAGACVYPRLTPLTDDKVEAFCLYGSQTILSAVTVDGGKLTVSERYP